MILNCVGALFSFQDDSFSEFLQGSIVSPVRGDSLGLDILLQHSLFCLMRSEF